MVLLLVLRGTVSQSDMECNNVFKTLLRIHKDVLPSAFIREFFEKCDQVFDLSEQRSDYERKLTKERLDRILHFNTTGEDESVAAQATLHYCSWNRGRLLKALSWPSWLYYHTVTRVTVASGGVIGVRPSINLLCYHL